MALIVGDSHSVALLKSMKHKKDALPFVWLKANGPPVLKTGEFNPLTLDMIKRGLQVDAEKLLFLFVGGNGHAMLGLLQHPVPFDLVLPDRPDLPIMAGAEIIPVAAIRAIMAKISDRYMRILDAIGSLGVPSFQFESPPPIADNDYIAARADKVFRRRHGALAPDAVSPKWLRYKLWHLQSQMYKAHCRRLKIRYVPVPKKVVDPEGFLLPQFWGNATHANSRYGNHLRFQISKIRSKLNDSQQHTL